MKIIALIGGMGSGKSVVCTILRQCGHSVYDCDSNAKRLMDASAEIKRQLVECFGNGVVDANGNICRPALSNIIFSDEKALHKVNSIVHPVVLDDILRKARASHKAVYFFETAIPHQSRLDSVADAIWHVTAPLEVRVTRAMARDHITRQQVLNRIARQDYATLSNSNISTIVNDGTQAVLPQVMQLLNEINRDEQCE